MKMEALGLYKNWYPALSLYAVTSQKTVIFIMHSFTGFGSLHVSSLGGWVGVHVFISTAFWGTALFVR